MNKLAINGFGRIGRNIFRQILDNPEFNVAIINDIAPKEYIVHALKYDSLMGVWDRDIRLDGDSRILVGDKVVQLTNYQNIPKGLWKEHGIWGVIESSGAYASHAKSTQHIDNGASKVFICAPAPDADKTVIMGVNEEILSAKDNIISSGSCTSSAIAPVIKAFKLSGTDIRSVHVLTVHPVTSNQSLIDGYHKDFRRARSPLDSIIPTTTTALVPLHALFPDIAMEGYAVRVPTTNVALLDIKINAQIKGSLAGILNNPELSDIIGHSHDELVSKDFAGSRYSVVIDEPLLHSIGDIHRVVGWYDNEVGYSARVIDLITYTYKLNKK